MRPIFSKVRGLAKWWFGFQEFQRRRASIINLWAAIEVSIDDANSAAWEISGRSISAVVPQNLGRKIELFKQIHRKLPAFVHLNEQATHIINELKALRDDRHWLVHGLFSPASSSAGQWRLKKTEFKPDGSVDFVFRTISDSEMSAIDKRVRNLALQIVRYGNALRAKIENDLGDDQPRQLTHGAATLSLVLSDQQLNPLN